MGRRAAFGLASALVLAGTGACVALRPTDESHIRAQLGRLGEALRVVDADARTPPVIRFDRVSAAFERLFDLDVHASVPELTSPGMGRGGLAELMTTAPRYVRTLDVTFSEVTVKLDSAGQHADVGATASIIALDYDGKTRREKPSRRFS